jgi:transposase
MLICGKGVDRVYLARGGTDLRKWIDGLATLVSQSLKLDPFVPAFFAFCNRKRDKLKILYWDHSGLWLYCRRLERWRFQWPLDM